MTHAYPFNDGTANDTVGTAHGQIMGGSVGNGVYTSSRQGDYIELPAGEITINTYPSITLEAYVTTNANNPAYSMLSYFGSTSGSFGTNYFFTALENGGNSCAAISCGNLTDPWNAENRVNASTLNDGMFYHLVSTLTNEAISWYINGAFAGSKNLSGNNSIQFLDNAIAYLCKSGYANDGTWIGSIDEFNIYSGVMDDQTISLRAGNIPTSLSELDAADQANVDIFPNPVNNALNIIYSYQDIDATVELTVFRLDGTVVLIKENNSSLQTGLNVADLDSGMYILQLRDGKKIVRKKFVIKH